MSEETTPAEPIIPGTPSQADDQGVGPDEPRIAHATRPDNVGKNWDGSDPEPTNAPDHTQLGSEEAGTEPEDRLVYLPQLISDEFAIQPDSARDMVLLGKVTIGGEIVSTERGWVSFGLIEDQEIAVDSDVKSVRFRYRG